MNTETLACAIVGHLVGDYLLQNDWMALNKKTKTLPLIVHCSIWTQCVMVLSGWAFLPSHQSWIIGSILALTHMAQDGSNIVLRWMRLIGQHRFMKCDDFDLTDMRVVPGLGLWSIIVVDNVWHILTIWVVWRFIA